MHLDGTALLIALLSLTGVAALAAGALAILRRSTTIADRLADPSAAAVPLPTLAAPTPRSGALAHLLAPIARVAMPMNRDELDRLRARLQQGGSRSEQAAILHVATKLLLATGALGLFLWMNSRRVHPVEPALVAATVAFALGYYLPDLLLSSRIQKRQTAIERGLPDALDLLVTCVEAGLGLDAAVQRVAEEVRLAWPVLGDELRTAFLEVKAGVSRIEAFRRLATRTGVADLRSLSATLAQTEIFGTSVALALRIQAEGIRLRRMQRAEERAAYVSVKMTLPLVLCILPSLFAILMGPAALQVARVLLPTLGGER